MSLADVKTFYELPRGIEEWTAQIESRWGNIPEFKVDPQKLQHLAIVCDGNRRAAEARGLSPYFGHRAGLETVKGIARAGRQWGIHTLTFWLWSTENWGREADQVKFIMGLAAQNLADEDFLKELRNNQVRFTHLGRKDRLSRTVADGLAEWEKITAGFNRYRLNLAIDYGGFDEIARALGGMITAIQTGIISPAMIRENPQAILGFLDTATQTLPDLVIRTGVKKGEILHTSGFMPLQTAYASWIFLPELFPNLAPQTLTSSIKGFLEYERRLGK